MNPKNHSFDIWKAFREKASIFSDRTAVLSASGQVTFSELYEKAEKLADYLSKSRIWPGEVVGLPLSNISDYVISFLALCRLSAIVALISPKYQSSELKGIIDNLAPRCFLVSSRQLDGFERKITPFKRGMIATKINNEISCLTFPDNPAAGKRHPLLDDTALIKFTSGSTGEPKGIALSAANILAETENVVDTLQITPTDRILAVVPISHSYGFDLGVLAMLSSGATLVLGESFIPRRILSDLETKGITIFLGVPSMYRFFLETPVNVPPDLSQVRYLLSCTAPLNPQLISEFKTKFGVPLCQHYGSSETGAATIHIPSEVLAYPESVGRAMRNVQISIYDDNGNELSAGEEGEIVIKSKAVALGYIMGEPKDRITFSDCTYRTGDTGVLDKHGYLYLRGRIDSMINVGGLKVSPLEVIQVLESQPAVREAAVIGVTESSGEQIVYAAVTLKGAATENDILEFCRRHLAEYKVPRRIDIVDSLPRTAAGKVKLNPGHIKW
jgi:long-chain acyl-CoA synthetase